MHQPQDDSNRHSRIATDRHPYDIYHWRKDKHVALMTEITGQMKPT